MADRHIAAGEAHIGRQEVLITELTLKGHPTAEAQRLMELLQETMVEHWTHRGAIVAALEGNPAIMVPNPRN